ncbi:SDR family oxidoreductase [Calothrix sp. FACHB-156]|nr:SDR family oxidoreductase [Nostoc linckia FACHB-104]MBD2338747.1 SDR family oxidoreductase [Calothrix sp. FACHB-156]
MKLEGSVVLITGASGGIGKEFIQGLLGAGVGKIYAAARRVEALESLKVANPDKIVPIKLDITNLAQVNEAAAQYQDVNVLINNAGMSNDQGVIAAPDMNGARQEIETNYFGTMAMCRAFAPVLKANGGGVIVNLVSFLGKINLPFLGTYSASKAAELSLTQCVRAELAAQGTLVVAVMPGSVDTEFAKYYPPPKVAPAEVVRVAIDAVINEVEDVYPGDQATYLATELLKDPKGIEKYLAGMLPGILEQQKQQQEQQ